MNATSLPPELRKGRDPFDLKYDLHPHIRLSPSGNGYQILWEYEPVGALVSNQDQWKIFLEDACCSINCRAIEFPKEAAWIAAACLEVICSRARNDDVTSPVPANATALDKLWTRLTAGGDATDLSPLPTWTNAPDVKGSYVSSRYGEINLIEGPRDLQVRRNADEHYICEPKLAKFVLGERRRGRQSPSLPLGFHSPTEAMQMLMAMEAGWTGVAWA